jgi:hypothetical protein
MSVDVLLLTPKPYPQSGRKSPLSTSPATAPIKDRIKRLGVFATATRVSSIVAAAVASMSEPVALTHSPSSASEQPKARRPSVEAAFAVPVKERVQSMSSYVSPQVPQQKPSGAPSLSQLLEQEQGATGAPVESPHMH